MASNGRDTTMDGLIRRSLANTAPLAEACPDPEILAAYYERSLDSRETSRWEMHVSQCARCRQQLAMMVESEESPRPEARYNWLWDWRLLATTAMALLVLGVWGLKRSALTPAGLHQGNEPLVAMSQPEQAPAPQPAFQQQAPQEPPAAAQPLPAERQSLDRGAIKMQAVPKTEAPAFNKALQPPAANGAAPPVNGRNFERELKPTVNTGDRANALSELKKEEQPIRVPGAPVASAAAPSTQLAPPARSEAGSENRAETAAPAAAEDSLVAGAGGPADDKSIAADAPRAKQSQSARVQGFGPALGGALGQLTEKRSGSTIIQTPDPKVLWRIAGGNFVERTENGGGSWSGQVADPDAQLTTGSAPTTKICWLVGKSGVILVTKDATHWKRIPPPVPADFVAIDAKNASAAVVTASDGQKFSTGNEGKKWIPLK